MIVTFSEIFFQKPTPVRRVTLVYGQNFCINYTSVIPSTLAGLYLQVTAHLITSLPDNRNFSSPLLALQILQIPLSVMAIQAIPPKITMVGSLSTIKATNSMVVSGDKSISIALDRQKAASGVWATQLVLSPSTLPGMSPSLVCGQEINGYVAVEICSAPRITSGRYRE